MNHFNRCQFCLNLDQVQNYGPHRKQWADDRFTHKTDQTSKSRRTLFGQFPPRYLIQMSELQRMNNTEMAEHRTVHCSHMEWGPKIFKMGTKWGPNFE